MKDLPSGYIATKLEVWGATAKRIWLWTLGAGARENENFPVEAIFAFFVSLPSSLDAFWANRWKKIWGSWECLRWKERQILGGSVVFPSLKKFWKKRFLKFFDFLVKKQVSKGPPLELPDFQCIFLSDFQKKNRWKFSIFFTNFLDEMRFVDVFSGSNYISPMHFWCSQNFFLSCLSLFVFFGVKTDL